MEIWFLQDIQRLNLEREAIRELESTSDWLIGTQWRLDTDLCLDTIIKVNEREYPVTMSYPPVFPAAPPVVYPTNRSELWSTHQYSGGTLCLEWRPDTWQPEVTGAQVLESAYTLLKIENPSTSGHRPIAPSDHHLSIGQSLRSTFGRLYVGKELTAYLDSLPPQCTGVVEFELLIQSESFLVLVNRVNASGETWVDTQIPQEVFNFRRKNTLIKGLLCKTNLSAEAISHIETTDNLEQVVVDAGLEWPLFDADDSPQGLNPEMWGVLFTDAATQPHFYLVLDSGEPRVMRYHSVHSDGADQDPRIPERLRELSGKSVGIVGLGSAGSKVILSLARGGVSQFYLVDDDVFLPENISRHALDWRNVGEHKVDAIARMLRLISSGVQVEVSRVNLTGQESTAVLSGVLSNLGHCDVLVDATANPAVFNLLAATATTYTRPLVWLEVYAGGIGGMIARSRPGLDPDPQTMRAAYHEYTLGTPMHELATTVDYRAEDVEGNVMSASDADVGVIASHAARLVSDTLLAKSDFPYSMYLIGFSSSWIFDSPFHTIPIATSHLVQAPESRVLPDSLLSENLAFLGELVRNQHAENRSTQQS